MRSCSRPSSIRISPTPRSSSVCDTGRRHPLRLDDPGHRDHLVASHHEGPAFAIRAGDLRVDEHVLDLPPAAGEPVAGPPSPYFKPRQLGLDAPAAPLDRAGEVDGPRLEPEALVLADRLHAAAEVDALRA